MFEVEQNHGDLKFKRSLQNSPSEKLTRQYLGQILESDMDDQNRFDLDYHLIMQKLELEMRQMKRQLGISPDIKENMSYALGLTTQAPFIQHGQTTRSNDTMENVGAQRRGQFLGNGCNWVDYEAEQSAANLNVFPGNPDLGPRGVLHGANGEKLTFQRENVVRDLFKLCNPHDIRDDNEDITSEYSNIAQCVNSINLPWGERTLENQNFKAELFKTEMCRSWSTFGLCPYGESCRFAHGRCELRVRPRPHWKYKTQLCKKFLAGYCPYGSRCSFVHMPNEQERAYIQRSSRSTAGQIMGMNRRWHRNSSFLDPRAGLERYRFDE